MRLTLWPWGKYTGQRRLLGSIEPLQADPKLRDYYLLPARGARPFSARAGTRGRGCGELSRGAGVLLLGTGAALPAAEAASLAWRQCDRVTPSTSQLQARGQNALFGKPAGQPLEPRPVSHADPLPRCISFTSILPGHLVGLAALDAFHEEVFQFLMGLELLVISLADKIADVLADAAIAARADLAVDKLLEIAIVCWTCLRG